MNMKKMLGVLTLFLIFCIALCGCGNSSKDSKLSFTLVAGEMGKYGKMITFNEGTEFELQRCAYYIPAGTYTVTNKGEYMSQVNVYSNEINITEEGWEEPATGEAQLIDVGKCATITISENQYVYITEPSTFKFVMN